MVGHHLFGVFDAVGADYVAEVLVKAFVEDASYVGAVQR